MLPFGFAIGSAAKSLLKGGITVSANVGGVDGEYTVMLDDVLNITRQDLVAKREIQSKAGQEIDAMSSSLNAHFNTFLGLVEELRRKLD